MVYNGNEIMMIRYYHMMTAPTVTSATCQWQIQKLIQMLM